MIGKIIPKFQGDYDSFCGIYALCNAYQIVKQTTDDEAMVLFEEIVAYLQKKKKLGTILIGGIYQYEMLDILRHVIKDRFLEVFHAFQWTDYDLDSFWRFSKKHLEQPNSAIILSLGGLEDHYTVIERMTDKTMFLADSGGIKFIRKNMCKFYDYKEKDKYVIHANGSFYVRG